MKKHLAAKIVALLLMFALVPALPAGAAVGGVEELAVAASGKNPIMNPEYIDGGAGFNDKEGSRSLLVYDEELDEGDKEFPKYCSDKFPYWAEWKYDKGYVVNRVILRTANDSEQYPRRPGDGWTLSGSNDGSSWDVIYTGKSDDVEDENYLYYWVDLNNTKEFQYYRFNADSCAEDQDQQIIQLSAIVLCEGTGPVVQAKWKPKNHKIGAGVTLIAAVDFDAGEANYGKSPADGAKDLRPDEAVNTQFNDTEQGGCIGWIGAGDWVQYTVKAEEGKYSFSAMLASDATSPGNVAIYLDDKLIGESENSKKAGWQTYDIYKVGEIEITAGTHVIKVEFPIGGLNLNALEITRVGDIEKPTEAPTEPPAAAGDGDNAGDGESPAGGETPSPEAKDEGGGSSNLVLIIIIGAALALVIVAALIVLTKKKK